MNTVILRTGSVTVQHHSFTPGSPRISLHSAGVFSGHKSGSASPTISLHLDIGRRSGSTEARGIRRAQSESDVIRLDSEDSRGLSRLGGVGSPTFPATIPEAERISKNDEGVGSIESLMLNERGLDRRRHGVALPESRISVKELGFPGGDVAKVRKSGGGGPGDDCCNRSFADRSKICDYYEEMLKSNPTNSLLLRNYGWFLHEVERDMVKAEEYYGRAILATPGDGEVLSLYGKLIWESEGDENRAKSYFDQAVRASPNDCMVLGSYAHFLWVAEEEDDDDEGDGSKRENEPLVTTMVEAF